MRLFAAGPGETVSSWLAETGEPAEACSLPFRGVNSLSSSADGAAILAGGAGLALLRLGGAAAQCFAIGTPTSPIVRGAFSSSGSLVLAEDAAGVARIYESATPHRLVWSGAAPALVLHKDEQVLTLQGGRAVRSHLDPDAAAPESIQCTSQLANLLALVAPGRVLARARTGELIALNPDTGAETPAGHGDLVSRTTANGRLAVAMWSGMIRILESATAKEVHAAGVAPGTVVSLFARTGGAAIHAATSNGFIVTIAAETGDRQVVHSGLSRIRQILPAGIDHSPLAVGAQLDKSRPPWWSPRGAAIHDALTGHSSFQVLSAAWDERAGVLHVLDLAGRIASFGSGPRPEVCKLECGDVLARAALNADGTAFAGASSSTLYRGSRAGDSWTIKVMELEELVEDVTVSADGQAVAAGLSSGGVLFGGTADEELRLLQPPVNGRISAVRLCLCAKHVILGTFEGRIVVVEAASGRIARAATPLDSAVTAIAVAPAGDCGTLLVGLADGEILSEPGR